VIVHQQFMHLSSVAVSTQTRKATKQAMGKLSFRAASRVSDVEQISRSPFGRHGQWLSCRRSQRCGQSTFRERRDLIRVCVCACVCVTAARVPGSGATSMRITLAVAPKARLLTSMPPSASYHAPHTQQNAQKDRTTVELMNDAPQTFSRQKFNFHSNERTRTQLTPIKCA